MLICWIIEWFISQKKSVSFEINKDLLHGVWQVYYLTGERGWSMLETQDWNVFPNDQVHVAVTIQDIPSYSSPIQKKFHGKIKNNTVVFSNHPSWIIEQVTPFYIIFKSPPKIVFKSGQQQIWKALLPPPSNFFMMDRG